MAYDTLMMKDILTRIRETLLTRCPLDALPEGVWKRTGALNTWGTNAIEGNTLDRSDVERILLEEKSVGNRPMPDILETIQHANAFAHLLERRKESIRMGTALQLHEEVFRGLKGDAGLWRRVNVRIAGMKHAPPRMEQVLPRMARWEEEYTRRDVLGEDPFALGAWMHFEFESIHPFSDGNGRVGRLLLNLHFLKHDWPPVHILPPDRARYLRSLVRGHDGDLSPLEDFLRIAMTRSMLDLLDQVGTREDELKPLRALARHSAYSAKYLGLRAGQEELPAIKISGDWQSSERAISAYRDFVGRNR
jgi:Fic family protein